MTRRTATALVATLAGIALLTGPSVAVVTAQRLTPADLAAAISGDWKINAELSPQFRAPAGRQGAAWPVGPSLAAGAGVRAVAAPVAVQRGGRGGGGAAPAAAPNPRDVAGQTALRALQQAADSFTIAATADSVTITNPRGSRTHPVDNKNHRVEIDGGAELGIKSRWDGRSLKQEFIYDETKVSHTYELSRDGNRLEFTMRVDDFAGGRGRQAEAVYDRVR